MVQISSKQVQSLRARTDLPMMDCKSALVEAGGDETKALELLRKKFADTMSMRAEKETANGRIGVYADDTGAALVELRCETDFVATNDTFRALADEIARTCLRSGVTDPEQIKSQPTTAGTSVQDLLVDAYGKLKENISLKRLVRIGGPSACYVHHNGRVAAAIACDKPPAEAGRQVCMHIASTPVILGLTRQQVDGRLVEEARQRAREEARGKPEPILNKIVDGKMEKWFAERVLVEQPFVMDDKKSVGQFARENGFGIQAFRKFEVGGMS